MCLECVANMLSKTCNTYNTANILKSSYFASHLRCRIFLSDDRICAFGLSFHGLETAGSVCVSFQRQYGLKMRDTQVILNYKTCRAVPVFLLITANHVGSKSDIGAGTDFPCGAVRWLEHVYAQVVSQSVHLNREFVGHGSRTHTRLPMFEEFLGAHVVQSLYVLVLEIQEILRVSPVQIPLSIVT